jgi:hypothetical protein
MLTWQFHVSTCAGVEFATIRSATVAYCTVCVCVCSFPSNAVLKGDIAHDWNLETARLHASHPPKKRAPFVPALWERSIAVESRKGVTSHHRNICLTSFDAGEISVRVSNRVI